MCYCNCFCKDTVGLIDFISFMLCVCVLCFICVCCALIFCFRKSCQAKKNSCRMSIYLRLSVSNNFHSSCCKINLLFQLKMLRQIANRILPNFEKDLSRNLSREVATMEELNFMAGRVYSYQTKPSSQSVFGSTSIRQAPAGTKLVRVEKPLPSKVGLFFD